MALKGVAWVNIAREDVLGGCWEEIWCNDRIVYHTTIDEATRRRYQLPSHCVAVLLFENQETGDVTSNALDRDEYVQFLETIGGE